MKTKHFAYERCDRLNTLIKEEVSDIILNHLNDPRIGFVTVTEVKVAHDLHHATIYVSFYGSDKKEGMEGLTHATGFIRTELGKRIKMRYVPEIGFKLDSSIETGAHVLSVIDSLEIPEGE
ncbi:MAG: 30S ribosome-binding factor RbfA [bacterium]